MPFYAMLTAPATSSNEVTQPEIFRCDYNRCVDCRRETPLSFILSCDQRAAARLLVAARVDTQDELRDVRARTGLCVGRLQTGLEKIGKRSMGGPNVDDDPVALRL